MIDIKTQILSATDVGLIRKANEDSYGTAETPNGTLCVVCDGMGGHAGGAEASRMAVNCIIQYLGKEIYPDIKQALKEALDFANVQIIGTASEHPELRGMGTTACVLLVRDDCVWLAHAGDSRIYLHAAREKRLHRLTKDHSYVQGLIDQGIISEKEAENHPNKNRILKALGIKEEVQADIAERPVRPAKGDIFLICSDGLSGMLSDKQIQAILSEKTTLQEKEAALMSAAKSAGGTDNITFQLIEITRSPHKKSVVESKNFAVSKVTRKRCSLKYALFVMAGVIVLLTGILIGRKCVSSQPETSAMPADSTKGINQPDTTIIQDTTMQTKPTNKVNCEPNLQ
jgi:protein phosphatase